MKFPGTDDFIAEYRKRAAAEKVDALGLYVPPFIYAAMQVMEQAVEKVGSLDEAKLAATMHSTTFPTIVGDVKFGADGEWTEGRILMTQFRGLHGNGLEQFDKAGAQVILYPKQFKTGDVAVPFPPAQK
jgi:branched-chain amino acid transport system substrate-binding protein